MANSTGRTPLTNNQAASILRALTRMQQDKATQRMVSERPLGATRARAVSVPDNAVGVGRSEAKRMSVKQPVTTRQVKPTGPRNALGPKNPMSRGAKIGGEINPRVNAITSEATVSKAQRDQAETDLRDPDKTAAARQTLSRVDQQSKTQGYRSGNDAQAIREAKESERSTKIQANDSARTGGKVQNPKAEPMTRTVVDEQARVGDAAKRGPSGGLKEPPNKASLQAMAKARNRIQATARNAGKPIEAPSSSSPGRLGGAHAGGQGISEEEMYSGARPTSVLGKLGGLGARMAAEEEVIP